MARDIYNRLIKLTGALDPSVPTNVVGPNEYRAARWLAQLSVNIVDYIDNDDYMTPFGWHEIRDPVTNAVLGVQEWVFVPKCRASC